MSVSLSFDVFLLQTSRIEFDLPEYSVRRRYQDFDWLRMKLEESQPTHLIPVRSGPAASPSGFTASCTPPPLTHTSSHYSVCLSKLQPLPEKFVMKGVVDRFSEEFVETRMKALDKFLKRVADHPVLSFNPHLNAFLAAKVRWRRCGRRPETFGLMGNMSGEEEVVDETGGNQHREECGEEREIRGLREH